MKRIMFLILVGVVTLGFSVQSYAVFNTSGWFNGKIGGIITGDNTPVTQNVEYVEGFGNPPNGVAATVDGMMLTATGYFASGDGALLIDYILNGTDDTLVTGFFIVGNNQDLGGGTTKDNGDGTFTWTRLLSGNYGASTYNELAKVTVAGPSSWVITRIAVELANEPPVANAGPDQMSVEATSPAGATATLNGSGSLVGDGTHLHYYWTTNAGVITEDAGGEETAIAYLSLGVNQTATVTLKVYDVSTDEVEDDFALDTALVKVVDTTAPIVTIERPEDGSEIPSATIPVSVHVDDKTATTVSVSLNSVTFALDGNGNAGGVIIKPNQAIDITATAVDLGGNVGSDTVTTIQVHDMRKP